MHRELEDEFLLWRLVVWEKIATRTEIEQWTVRDIFKANAMIDLKRDIEESIYGGDNKRIVD